VELRACIFPGYGSGSDLAFMPHVYFSWSPAVDANLAGYDIYYGEKKEQGDEVVIIGKKYALEKSSQEKEIFSLPVSDLNGEYIRETRVFNFSENNNFIGVRARDVAGNIGNMSEI